MAPIDQVEADAVREAIVAETRAWHSPTRGKTAMFDEDEDPGIWNAAKFAMIPPVMVGIVLGLLHDGLNDPIDRFAYEPIMGAFAGAVSTVLATGMISTFAPGWPMWGLRILSSVIALGGVALWATQPHIANLFNPR